MTTTEALQITRGAIPTEDAESLRALFVGASYEKVTHVDKEPYEKDMGQVYSCRYDRSVELEKDPRFIEMVSSKVLPLLPDGKCRFRAYRMVAGDYFRIHTDAETSFIYYLSKNWWIDWGGVLHAFQQGKVSPFVPIFNALVTIKKSAPHFVSMVTEYAQEPRYAVTGFID